MQEAAERPSVAPYVPHSQFVQGDVPPRLYLPAVHGKQEGWPVLSWYLPAVQEIHED